MLYCHHAKRVTFRSIIIVRICKARPAIVRNKPRPPVVRIPSYQLAGVFAASRSLVGRRACKPLTRKIRFNKRRSNDLEFATTEDRSWL